ncbi:J domain-containing protein [Novosphingobium aquimarinum]|uniref:J domain-containing protein n=1 Tax=Novosphingobium aquimarinum TaxID=2682494 RepID=UPI0018DE121E|nr:J domain-containing protein [Novosphingobium aquimarinum]
MRTNYYDVLGVSPAATAAEIKARYLALMRRNHPDVNSSPMANRRAAELNEAFRCLTDPEMRRRHDEQLARRRAEAISVRSVALGRQRRGTSLALRRKRPFYRRYETQIAVIALVVATSAAAWRIEQDLLAQNRGNQFGQASPEDDGEARLAVAAISEASARETQAMPVVSQDAVASGVNAFRRISAGNDPAAVRAASVECHDQVGGEFASWENLDFCVAFDLAAFLAYARDGTTSVNTAYFVDRHDRAAHLYVSRVVSLEAIDRRLAFIRGLVEPKPAKVQRTPTQRVLHGIAKRGRNLLELVFDGDPESNDSQSADRDF